MALNHIIKLEIIINDNLTELDNLIIKVEGVRASSKMHRWSKFKNNFVKYFTSYLFAWAVTTIISIVFLIILIST